MENKIKKGLFSFLFLILLLPFIQQNLPFIKSAGLKGYYDYAPEVPFTWEKWFDERYRGAKSNYYNDCTGFRPDLVRLNNQIQFSLFNQMGNIIGYHNCLFFDNYVYSYCGRDFMGDKAIRERLLKLNAISDTLTRLGKSLILVHAPNKAYFYAEDIPEPYGPGKVRPTNLQSYLRIGDSLGINQIDFNGWFVSMKNTSKELLLSKQGTHWTNYGAFIAGDSLVRYLERIRNINMLHPVVTAIRHTKNPSDPDADINDLSNLIFRVADETFSYPVFTYPDDSTKKKPRVIFIGDSFVINLLKNWMLQGTTSDWQFWFYFKYVMNKDNRDSAPTNPLVANFDWLGEIRKTDCIVLLYTSTNLPQLGNGFIEQAYDYYYPKK